MLAQCFPHHAPYVSLLDKRQYEACQSILDEAITEQMRAAQPDDLELAHLHIYLSRALIGLSEREAAVEKADIGVFLARKVKNAELLAEALYRSGLAHGCAGSYRPSIQRFTECLEHATGLFRTKTLYNRGHTYANQCAYSFAVGDYEAALALAVDLDPPIARICRINLAWVLILRRDFQRAEALIGELSAEPGAETDQLLQLQLAHDRVHVDYLQGHHREALKKAFASLRQAGKGYPHIRAHIALTIMSLAAEVDVAQDSFAMAVLAKRLASQADRTDLDDEASRHMQSLECQAGTASFSESLQAMRQILPGALKRRRALKGLQEAGGVG